MDIKIIVFLKTQSYFSFYHILELFILFSATNCTLIRQHFCKGCTASQKDNAEMGHVGTHIKNK